MEDSIATSPPRVSMLIYNARDRPTTLRDPGGRDGSQIRADTFGRPLEDSKAEFTMKLCRTRALRGIRA